MIKTNKKTREARNEDLREMMNKHEAMGKETMRKMQEGKEKYSEDKVKTKSPFVLTSPWLSIG